MPKGPVAERGDHGVAPEKKVCMQHLLGNPLHVANRICWIVQQLAPEKFALMPVAIVCVLMAVSDSQECHSPCGHTFTQSMCCLLQAGAPASKGKRKPKESSPDKDPDVIEVHSVTPVLLGHVETKVCSTCHTLSSLILSLSGIAVV